MGKMFAFVAQMGAVAGEVLSGIRTLITLQNEARVLAEHRAMIVKKNVGQMRNALLFSSVFGIFFMMQYILCAITAVAGGAMLVADRRAVVHADAVAKWNSGSDATTCAFQTDDISVLTDWSAAGMTSISYDFSDARATSTSSVAQPPSICNATLACSAGGSLCAPSLACEAACVQKLHACIDGTDCMTGSQMAQALIIFFFGMMAAFGSIMATKTVAEGGEAAKKVLHVTERTSKIVAYGDRRLKPYSTTTTSEGPLPAFGDSASDDASNSAALDLASDVDGDTTSRVDGCGTSAEDADVTSAADGDTTTVEVEPLEGGAEASGEAPGEDEAAEKAIAMAAPLITFEQVRFRYPARPLRCVLDCVSFTIERGKQTAFVGASGSGKSTVMQLLLRFYDPNSGRVLLDGAPLQTYGVATLRDEIGVVGQEPKLFQARVWENIAWGARSEELDVLGDLSLIASFDALVKMSPAHQRLHADIITASTTAQAHSFILRDLADGYDQLLLEGGRAVSGGQKQRIAIARALVRRPAILLLDEATSALDSESERKVQAALERDVKARGLTMVMIAHRLSTLAHCDHVIVMDAGRVVERGSYAELAARDDGHFKQMLAEQGIVRADDEGEGGAAGPPPPPQRQESEEATPRAETDTSLTALGEALENGAEKDDARRKKNETEEATPRAETDSSLTALGTFLGEALENGAAKDDARRKKNETERSTMAAFVGSVRSACAVVMCDSKTTLFYFIMSTVVGVVAMPMIMMSMLMQLMVLAVIYSDTDTAAIDATKWWIFFELMVAAAVIFFLGVFW